MAGNHCYCFLIVVVRYFGCCVHAHWTLHAALLHLTFELEDHDLFCWCALRVPWFGVLYKKAKKKRQKLQSVLLCNVAAKLHSHFRRSHFCFGAKWFRSDPNQRLATESVGYRKIESKKSIFHCWVIYTFLRKARVRKCIESCNEWTKSFGDMMIVANCRVD